MIRYIIGVTLLACCTYIGGATAAGGTDTPLAADRQLVNVLRGEHIQASYRRCLDEQTRFQYQDVRTIPASKVRAIIRTWTNRLAAVRASREPRAVCSRSQLWAESSAGRCVSSREGGLTSLSPGGTYAGKWQMDASFERAYGAYFVKRWGRAYNWPEWAQDVAAYRGYSARGWWPWPNTARTCGLL